MLIRMISAAVLMVLFATSASAGPIQWGYRALYEQSGTTYQVSGLTDTMYWESLLPMPEPVVVKRYDGHLGGGWEKEATTSARVTIIDEASGHAATTRVWWTRYESWFANQYPGWEDNPYWQGPEMYSRDDFFGPSTWGSNGSDETRWDTLGRHRYRVVSNEVGVMRVEVEPASIAAVTPEPGTLILGGIALAGGVAAWWRRKRN